MNQPLGVIFDVDGVLVDSYDAHFKSWQALGKKRGFEFTEAQFLATFGRTTRELLVDTFGDRRFTAAEIAELDACKEAIFRDLLVKDFPVMDGAVELIDQLHAAGYRLAVGSSGPPDNVDLVLRSLRRADVFQGVVSGADVQRGKPDPEVFLTAAARLGIAPQGCAVIEDAPVGIKAAKHSGATCIALVSKGHSRDELQAADHIVGSLRDLSPTGIAELLRSR
jgi:beta-phosphoglucomutase